MDERMKSSLVIDALRMAWFSVIHQRTQGYCFIVIGEVRADSTGRRNTFDRGVYGAACRLDAKVDGTWSDAFARCAVTS